MVLVVKICQRPKTQSPARYSYLWNAHLYSLFRGTILQKGIPETLDKNSTKEIMNLFSNISLMFKNKE